MTGFSPKGARDGIAKAGSGGGEKKKGRAGEKASGGDKQTTETYRPRSEAQRKTEVTGKKRKGKKWKRSAWFIHLLTLS